MCTESIEEISVPKKIPLLEEWGKIKLANIVLLMGLFKWTGH